MKKIPGAERFIWDSFETSPEAGEQKKQSDLMQGETFSPGLGLGRTFSSRTKLAVEKGGAGSGNFGHSGRPGKVGGSSPDSGGPPGGVERRVRPREFDIENFPKDAKEITDEQAMTQANYADIQARMMKNLGEIRHKQPSLTEVSGKITQEAANTIVKNMKAELSVYSNYLAGDTMGLARDYIDSFQESINKGITDGSLKGIKAEDLNALALDNIKKMLYQEVESNRQAFTDHGVRHIAGNVLRQKAVLREMNPDVTGKEELMGDFIMTNHDVGYTTPLIRAGGLRGVMMTKKHPAFSERIAQQQASLWNEGKIFSKAEYGNMLGIMRTHDSTEMDAKAPLATSTRISDNLSLFSKEKLPGMFRYVQNGDQHLIEMGLAAKKNDTVAFEKAKAKLYAKIESANISTQLQRDLKAATKEITFMTPKFTLGVLAGEVASIGKSSDGKKVEITIKYNKYDSFLQDKFDMGQKQTKKFLEDYGIKDFTATEYDVGDVLKLKVTGAPGKKELQDLEDLFLKGIIPEGFFDEEENIFIDDIIIDKGGAGSGNHGHSGRPGKRGGSAAGGASPSSFGSKTPVTQHDKDFSNVLTAMRDMVGKYTPEDFAYSSSYDMVLKEGRFFTPQERPADIPKDKDKECFMNASHLALGNPEYTYCEGFASSKGIEGLPIAHAWVVDKKGNVIDSTWKTAGVSYIGIPFKTEYLEKTLLKTRVYGLIPDMPMRKYNPVKDGFPKDAIATEPESGRKKDFDFALLKGMKGGAGSGNFGHAGRPGKIGGSGDGSASGGTGIENLDGIVRGYLSRLHSAWKEEFPKEEGIDDPSYMEWEFKRQGGDQLPLLFDQIAEGNVQTKVIAPQKPYYSYQHGCFYNSLAYAKDHPEVDLAFGAIFEKEKLKRTADWASRADESRPAWPLNFTDHSFCIDKKTGAVIDPTLGKANDGEFYVFKKVPKSVVDKLTVKPNDSNYDAREYSDYIDGEYKKVADKFDFVKFMGSDKPATKTILQSQMKGYPVLQEASC